MLHTSPACRSCSASSGNCYVYKHATFDIGNVGLVRHVRLPSLQELKESPVLPRKCLEQLADDLNPIKIPWQDLREFGILNRIMKPRRPKASAGVVLAYSKQQVVSFREHLRLSVCVFKIGVTANPICRFLDYRSKIQELFHNVGHLPKRQRHGDTHA